MEKNKISNIIISVIFCASLFIFGIPSLKKTDDSFNTDKQVSVKQNILTFESVFKENFYKRAEIVNLHGFTQKLIGNNLVEDAQYDAMVRDEWGQITSTPKKSNLKKLESFVCDINDYAKDNDAKALYVQAPFKILPNYENIMPEGTAYTTINENADNLLKSLSHKGIDCLDLRPVLEQSPIPEKDRFFKTDHHWTINSAFYCYGQIVSYMNKNYGYGDKEEMDFVTNPENFNKYTIPNSFLGAWGRRTGELYAELENFDYFVPGFTTEINITNRAPGAEETKRSGEFYNLVMSPSFVENHDYEAVTGRYSLYLNGYTSEVLIENLKSENDKKVLIFHDSFGFPVSSFMSLSARHTTIIDVRAFEKPLIEYIKEYAPDYILFVFNPDEADFVGMKY